MIGLLLGNLTVWAVIWLIAQHIHKKKLEQMMADHIQELKELEEKNRKETKQIFTVISHEIRMPISIAMGYSELIQRGMVTDSQEKELYIRRICEQMNYLNESLKSALAGWEAVVGPEPGTLKEMELMEFLTSMLPDMRCAAIKKGIGIQLDFLGESAVVMADSVQLKKVFYNLLENSIKYTQGGGNITIIVQKKRGERCQVIWKDDGGSMEPGEVCRIFECGYQGSNRKEGSGMGLYIVKRLLEHQGASICAKSPPDGGLDFHICFDCKL